MEYISSDTNVWLDFVVIGRLELPFRLPYIYLMNQEAAEDELLNPPGLGEDLRMRNFFWRKNLLVSMKNLLYMIALPWL